jgi:hypothetical protein
MTEMFQGLGSCMPGYMRVVGSVTVCMRCGGLCVVTFETLNLVSTFINILTYINQLVYWLKNYMPQLILAASTLIILFVEIMLEFSKEN